MTKKIVGAATARVAASSAGAKVVVASKLPMSLDLQMQVKRTNKIRDRGTIFEEEVWVKTGKIVTLSGTSYPVGAPPEGVVWPDRPRMVAGCALTYGVDKDFFDAWLEQNGDMPAVRNGLIFAFEREADVAAQARDSVDIVSGLQAINPAKDPRLPKKLNASQLRAAAGAEADEPALADAE